MGQPAPKRQRQAPVEVPDEQASSVGYLAQHGAAGGGLFLAGGARGAVNELQVAALARRHRRPA